MEFSFRNSTLYSSCEFLLVFDDGNFSEDSTFLITDWFNCTPKDIVSYHISDLDPIKTSGVRIIDSTKFPAASTIAGGIVQIEPSGLIEMHWHPHSQEWQYYIE